MFMSLQNLYCLLFSLIHLFVISFSSSSSLLPSAVSLLQFLHSLPPQSQSLLPWNSSISPPSPCQWPGVSCYPNKEKPVAVSQIKALNLSGLGLSGLLNDSVSYLCKNPFLLSLDLSGNRFTGNIPEQLGRNCGRLHTILLNDNLLEGKIPPGIFKSKWISKLDLGFNSLSGNLPPEVSLCENLEFIGLYNNHFSGELPGEIFALPKLKFLYLHSNNFTGSLPEFPDFCGVYEIYIHENSFSGSLPNSLGNCLNLTMFIASNNNFGGLIPSGVFKSLLKLEILYLDGNNFEGLIPESLWGLENLQELVLSNNKFNGTIPEKIGNCKLLSIIALSGNNFVGKIPRSIGDLTGLTSLYLFENMFGGSLPAEIGNCISLVELRIQSNIIGGIIPDEICNLVNLEILFMFNNRFKGNIPRGIGQMSNLVQLALYNNSLSGEIPSGITRLRKLEFLSFAHNNLTGRLLSEFGRNFPSLVKLDLTGNNFYGLIPSSICTGNNLSVLTLGNNRFNGSFPIEIAKCSSLRRVILSNNLLHGSIPVNLGANDAVSYLEVRGNELEGNIPLVFGYWSNLTMLDFSENRFSGMIPLEFGKLKGLQVLRLSSNRLNGSIPSELGNCTKLIELDLSKNYLSDKIPPKITSLEKLQSLLLQHNKLSGNIPDDFSSSQSLLELDLGSNMLEGNIPCSLSNLHHLSSVLNVSSNKLSGKIPACLGNLDKLQVLDISSNNFFGEIPTEVNNMISLYFVNASFNHLSGKLPSTWNTLMASYPGSFLGNEELCFLSNQGRFCGKVGDRGRNKRKVLAGIIIAVIVSVLSLCALVYIFVLRKIQKRYLAEQSLVRECRSMTEDLLPEDLRFEDIMRATEGWSDKYIIGRGKHGTVYRTESLNSRKDWAIKRVNLSETNFSSEMRTLSLVRHRNVVKMTGYCIKDGYGFIVTDYMSGGSLFEVLHRSQPRVALDWETRYGIAFGIAQGLCYLHHDCVPQIIHRDIKSDNIFLDSEMVPKIGDFGMAKLIVADSDSGSTSSAIVGTLGYIAPENAYSIRLTEKSDVYSYGVILLELLFRKMPVDPSFEEGLDIVSWTRHSLLQNPSCVFFDHEICFWSGDNQRKALRLLDLALECTQQSVDARPSMRDVVASLIKLNDRHKGSVKY